MLREWSVLVKFQAGDMKNVLQQYFTPECTQIAVVLHRRKVLPRSGQLAGREKVHHKILIPLVQWHVTSPFSDT